MEDVEICRLLEKYSTKCFAIEFGGYFSNHVSHGIVALARLGATRERIEQFVTWYSSRLEKPEETPKEMTLPKNISEGTADFQKLLGKRVAYMPLVEHYKKSFQEDCGGSMEKFIAKYLPPMLEGLQCSALHPLIQAGYGYNAKCPTVVIEGIAYLHHSFYRFAIPENNTFGQGKRGVMEILEDIRKDDKLCSFDVIDESDLATIAPDVTMVDIYQKFAALSNSRSHQLAKYVDQIKLPEWFQLPQASYEDVFKLCKWVLDSALAVYVAAETKNDFFLLHGVTGAWALKEMIRAMKEVEVKSLILCIQEFLYILFAVYIVQNRPKMIPDHLKERGEDEAWELIIQDALESETEEHIYKMVQVCHERAMEFPPEEQGLFKMAARACIQHEFFYR